MQIGSSTALMLAGEEAPKLLDAAQARPPDDAAPDAGAFGDLLRMPEELGDPGHEASAIVLPGTEFSRRASALALPDGGGSMNGDGGKASGPVGFFSENSENVADSGMRHGWQDPEMHGRKDFRADEWVAGGGRSVGHEGASAGLAGHVPSSVPPFGEAGDEAALQPGSAAPQSARSDGKASPQPVPVDVAGRAGPVMMQDAGARRPEATGTMQPHVPAGAAGGREEQPIAGAMPPLVHAASGAPAKSAEPGQGRVLRADAATGATGEVMPGPQDRPLHEKQRPQIRGGPDEERIAVRDPASPANGHFSLSAAPVFHQTMQEPDFPGPAASHLPTPQLTAGKQPGQGGSEIRDRSVAHADLRSGQARTDGETAKGMPGGVIPPVSRGDEAGPAPLPLKTAETPPAPAPAHGHSGPGAGGEGWKHLKGAAGAAPDTGAPFRNGESPGGAHEADPAWPGGSGAPSDEGKRVMGVARDPADVPGKEIVHQIREGSVIIREGSVIAEADAAGYQLSGGPEAVREAASTARAHTAPHHPALERNVIQQIAQAAAQISDRPIELRLNPEELGRVRLVLSLGENNAISVSIQAERPETLDLMRRNIGDLAREFRDLGYDNPEFSFGSGAREQGGRDEAAPLRAPGPGAAVSAEAGPDEAAARSRPAALVLEMSERLDLRL